ncbi:MAG: hypothetical protein AAGK21_07625 [Bacteroidota bacterium]
MRLLLSYPLVTLGVFLWVAAAMVPPLAYLEDVGFAPSLGDPLVEALTFSALGGALAGALTLWRTGSSRIRSAVQGALVGSLACTGGAALMLAYMAARRWLLPSLTAVWTIEFALMLILGAVPGLALASRWFNMAEIGEETLDA